MQNLSADISGFAFGFSTLDSIMMISRQKVDWGFCKWKPVVTVEKGWQEIDDRLFITLKTY